MNKLAELNKHLASLKGKATAILDAADAEARGLTDDETASYELLEADIEAAQSEIKGIEANNERRRTMDAIQTSTPALSVMVNDPNPETTHGFKDIGEFSIAVRNASAPSGQVVDPRLLGRPGAAPTNFHKGGGSGGEGYLVPDDFRQEVQNVIDETDDLLADVDLEPTNAREVKSMADETTPWGASGITARWRSEGSQMTAEKLSQEPRTTPLHELYAFVTATEELLEDAPRLMNRITNKAGLAISWKKSDAVVYGTGAGQPLGWFNSAALVSVAKEAGQTADTIVAENVLKMYSRLLKVPGDSPYWLMNTDVVPQLATMTIGSQPIWTPPSSGLTGAPGGFLLGLPIKFSEHAKTLGDKGDIQLVSPKGYAAYQRSSGPKFASSMHLYFDYGVEAFRWTFRFGGQPHLSGPVSPANGANTKSHFITLDPRA